MNVYDFDKTIYNGDSTVDFYLYCLRRHPRLLINLPKQFIYIILYMFGKYDKTCFKEHFYTFLTLLENVDKDIESFWNKYKKNIKHFYKKQQKSDDVVISASPEFLLEPICSNLGIKTLMASKVDKHTGKYTGINCYGNEKVKRFNEIYQNENIDNFYSDSFSDEPLAKISNNAYIVCKETITSWNNYTPSALKKLKNMFFSKSFILFLFVGCINTLNGIVFSYLYSLLISNANVAFVIGYITSLTISYFLNSFITFKEKFEFKKYVKFCISYIPNFIIQNIIVIIFYNTLEWNKLIAYALAAFIGLPVTFLLMNVFAFKKKKEPNLTNDKDIDNKIEVTNELTESTQNKNLQIYKILDRTLFVSAYLYLVIPIAIFLAFWFKPYISILAILALTTSFIFVIRKFKYKTIEEYRKIFNLKKIILVLFCIVIINILSGAGGIFYQNWDYKFRNTVFHDLINYDWPVKYDFSNLEYESNRIGKNTGVLGYYFTYWLPSAIVGKFLGFRIASLFMLLWQTLGVSLFFYLVFRKLNNVKLKYFLVFLAFGGLDIIIKFITCITSGQPLELLGTYHIDTANVIFVMSSFVTQLFWVFNQAVPAWIATMLLVNDENYSNLGMILALLVPHGPFPTLGLAVWMFIITILGFNLNNRIDKTRIKELFSIQNILAVLSVIPIGLLFLQNSNSKGIFFVDAYKNGDLNIFLISYLLFIIFEFGIYSIIITKENRRKVLTYFLIFSIFPLFYVGIGVDLGNRATIPILVLLYIEIIKFLDSKTHPKRNFIVYIILLIAFTTNFNEIYRSINYTHYNKENGYSNFNDVFQTFGAFEQYIESDTHIKNFVTPYDKQKFYFSKIFK